MTILIFYLAFFLFSVFISIADIKTGTVSRCFMWLSAVALFLLKYAAYGKSILLLSVIGCAIGLLVFYLAYYCSRKKLGLADVWYAGIMGIVLGAVYWYPAVIVACIFAVISMVFMRKKSLPFLPFMAAGTWIVLLFIFFTGRSV
jgi:prepilin signal peptidase PulO-like enzyme (type II secretory pathway)